MSCGKETIVVAIPVPIELEMLHGKTPDYSLSEKDVHKLFTVDRLGCPIGSLKLSKDGKGTALSELDSETVKLDALTSVLTVLNNVSQDSLINFYVEATTLGGIIGYKEYKITVVGNPAP